MNPLDADVAIIARQLTPTVVVLALVAIVCLAAYLRGRERPRAPSTVTSRASGNWSDPNTWNSDAIPGPGDRVVIRSGHTITVDGNTP